MNDVVRLEYMNDSIAIITMEDRVNKNTFSADLVAGVQNYFTQAQENPLTKVIILQGYDSYFCCGGMKEDLLKLADGKMVFTDMPFYSLLLECKLPVIAAMQGHALGGGLAFSSFADIMIMAEEATYSSNFLKYGFTPGFGATYIMPKKFGPIFGVEMLYTAQEYEGRDLKQRNSPIRIVKKNEVLPLAIHLAKDLAEKPRLSLELLKKQLVQSTLQELPAYIEQELAMHKLTLNTPEAKQAISKLFGEY